MLSEMWPYPETGDGELGDQLDDLGVVVHLDQLPQLVIGLEACKQPAELVVVVGVRQTLSEGEETDNQFREEWQNWLLIGLVCDHTNPVKWGNWQSVLWGMADLVTDRSPLWPDKPCQKVRKLTVLWGIADMVAGKSPLWLMTAYIALFSILKHTHCFFVIWQTLSKVRKLTISSVGNTDLVTRKSPLWSDTPTLTLTDKQSPHLA